MKLYIIPGGSPHEIYHYCMINRVRPKLTSLN